MEQICDIVLKKCISIYEEALGAESLTENIYGAFPTLVQITQFKTIPGRTKLSNRKENIHFWKYENSLLESVDNIQDSTLFLRDGMFYNIASFSFEITETKVVLEYVFGPRFGRGLEFTVKRKNNQISLTDEKHIWAS